MKNKYDEKRGFIKCFRKLTILFLIVFVTLSCTMGVAAKQTFIDVVLVNAYSSYDGSIATYQDFRNGTNNTMGYDADGYYGRQCWDGVQILYKRLGMSLSTGGQTYVKYCWLNENARAVNTGNQFVQITNMNDVRRGDILVFGGQYGHIAFADENNNPGKSTITIWGQNQVGGYDEYYFTACEMGKSSFLGAFRYKEWANKDPYGALDECSGGYGTIHVRGWAKDDNALNESLTVKVCVGGTLGSSAPSYTITANKSRSDVGGNYGFDETIKVNATGTQSVYVYAINKPDGNNPCIGSASVAIQTCSHPSWSSVITRQATCTEEGLETLTCTTCGSTKTQAIPKVDHTPETDPAVPPTITSTGLTEGSHCSVCGLVLVEQEVVPMLPRVLYDFDLDGVAEPVISLPKGLDTIEPNAFEGSGAEVVIIPDGVTDIGGRAFAEMPNLKAVFFPETVKKITFDIFENSPNVTLYVQKGSKWGTRLDLPYVEIETDWVSEDEVPAGAVITDERWKYDYVVSETKKTTSPITEEGWVLVSTDWETVSTGSQKCVDGYPSGFHGSQNYTTDKWSSYTNDLMKREVTTSVYTYTYWHWCFNSGYVSSGNYNIFVSDIPYEVDNKGRYYQYFTWLESSTNAGHVDPNGVSGGDCFYYWRNTPSDGSWWWFRFPVYQQTKVDKQKVYTYSRIINETRISPTPVDESETIKNVRHEVLYSFE